jgi:hypothetical protein
LRILRRVVRTECCGHRASPYYLGHFVIARQPFVRIRRLPVSTGSLSFGALYVFWLTVAAEEMVGTRRGSSAKCYSCLVTTFDFRRVDFG